MTDEQIIEAMAKAIWDDDWGMPDYDEETTTRVRNRCRVKARAALAAAKPLIREQALREAASIALIEGTWNASDSILALISEKSQ